MHTTLTKLLCSSALLFFGFTGLADAQSTPQKPRAVYSGLLTLYKLDPLLQSFCFTENHAGSAMDDHHVSATLAEIDFGAYRSGSFSVGVTNGSTGRIVDLGTSETLSKKYQYSETVGNGQGYASIHRKGTSFLIKQRRDKNDDPEYQDLAEGDQLLTDLRSLDSAPVTLGHIYLLHVVRTGDWQTDIFVKLVVVAYQADQSVTIRWETLPQE